MITICDTGPLVGYLNRNDPYHSWAVKVVGETRPPLLTCEPVLTEAAYFLHEEGRVGPLFDLLARGVLRIGFEVESHWQRMRTLMKRYERMDFTDAAVVVMSELHEHSRVLTVDRRDFSIYRRHDRRVIDFIAPPV